MNKKRLAVFFVYGTSQTNSSFALAKFLEKNNYDIIYATIYKQDFDLIERNGFNCKYFDRDSYIKDQKLASNYNKLSSFERIKLRKKLYVVSRIVINDQITQWISDIRPEIGFVDSISPIYSIAFLKYRIPLIQVSNTFSHFVNLNYPPVLCSKICKDGLLHKLLNISHWVSAMLKVGLYLHLQNWFNLLIHGHSTFELNKIVKKYNGKLRFTEYGYKLKNIPEMYFVPKHLDFPIKVKYSNGIYFKPLVDINRKEEINNLRIPNDKKIIYCSFGSCSHAYKKKTVYKIFYSIIEAFKNSDEYQVIIVTGNEFKLKSEHENITILEKAPQLYILSKADVFITQGGSSSLNEALYYGVPIVIFPFWHNQFGNAARIEYHKLGKKLRNSQIPPMQIKPVIEEVLQSKEIKNNVINISQTIKETNNNEILEFIENQVNINRAKK